MQGSYQLGDFTTNTKAEINRLKGQVDLFFEQEFAAYTRLGLRDGLRIIECGSGPGFLIREIALRLPACQATALEIDPVLVEILKENALHNGRHLYTALQGSIMATGLPDASFDLAITRLVLEHLPDPLTALHELFRILKPGGRLIIVSNDFSHHLITYPHIPELDLLYEAYCASQTSKGGNPRLGRQLPGLLAAGGFGEISLRIINAHSGLSGDKGFFRAENVHISAQLVKEGFLEKAILDRITLKWHEMLKTGDHLIYRPLFLVSGCRGQAAAPPRIAEATATPSPARLSLTLQTLQQVPAADRKTTVENYLTTITADALALTRDKLMLPKSLSEQGIDSVGAVELSNILAADFTLEVSHSDLLENLSPADLVGLILARLTTATTEHPTETSKAPPSDWEEGEL